MKYESAIEKLESLQKFGSFVGLARMEKILEELGDPQKDLKFVHVTGTNGKGSTCAMVASILKEAGYSTGLFTSPHLYSYTERIRIDGQSMSEDDFSEYFERVMEVVDGLVEEDSKMAPPIFEVLVAVSFLYFKERNVDIVVVEVGIGGQYDPTNVIESLVSVVTNIDLEHTEVLGKTKEDIAHDKAGIITSNSIVVTAEQDSEMVDIFEKVAKNRGASLIVVDPDEIKAHHMDLNGQRFDFSSHKGLELPLLGQFQLVNAATAIMTVEALRKNGYSISDEAIYRGLKKVKWPLRLEIIHQKPLIIADVGHNLHGVSAIVKEIDGFGKSKKKILITGASYDKPSNEMAKILAKDMDVVIVTESHYKAAPAKDIAESLQKVGIESLCMPAMDDALKKALELASEDDVVFVFGGLYLVSDAAALVSTI